MLLLALSLVGCALFSPRDNPVDKLCIKGQVYAATADTINVARAANGDKIPSYCIGQKDDQGRPGTKDCTIEELDRYLAGRCSEAVKSCLKGDCAALVEIGFSLPLEQP